MESNKRQREDDFDDPAKRQHVDPTVELISNICKDIRRIGENSNLAAQTDDIAYILNPIVAEFEKIDKLREAVLNTLYAVVIEQPQKITSLLILVFVCNAKNFLVAKYVVEFFHLRAQALVDSVAEGGLPELAGVFNDLKSVFSFLAALLPIIEKDAVGTILKQLLASAVQVQQSSTGRNGIAEEIYYNVLMATPYLFVNDKTEAAKAQANEIVEKAEQFVVDADKSLGVLEPFDAKNGNFSELLPYHPQKLVNLILPAIKALQGDDKLWTVACEALFLDFSELVQPVIESALSANTISKEIVKHSLPQLSLPNTETLQLYEPKGAIDRLWQQHPRLAFQVYTAKEFETVPPIELYHGLFFKDLAFDILTNLHFNQREALIQLSILDLFCLRDLFAPPGSSLDQLALISKDNKSGENIPPLATWKVEDVAVESILTMIFQLPQTLNREIYYYTVLILCCRESPDLIAPVFGRAIRFFYSNLETLDYELKIRYMDWMTTQISNFDFSWKWDEWASDSERLRNLLYHPKKTFIKNLIAKEIRLSNKARIKDSFVAMTPDESGEAHLMSLNEFHKYLDISLFRNTTEYIVEYDYNLYGANDEALKTTIANSIASRREQLTEKLLISPQEEVFYEFSNPQLPLHEIANKLYDFIIANWRSNEQFHDMVNEAIEAIKLSVVGVSTERVLVNLLFQTYAYIGSRSIYSVVSILNRDMAKLKFVSGTQITEEDYKTSGTDFRYPPQELSEGDFQDRQQWIIESIFRIWMHQPQVAFLILEYLIEFGILETQFLVRRALDLGDSLIITNVSCMESINRVLSLSSKGQNFKRDILMLFQLIVDNLNTCVEKLNIADGEAVPIIKDFSDEEADDLDLMGKIDLQWLFYEYRGLLKTYLRKFSVEHGEYVAEAQEILEQIKNEPVRKDVFCWLEELK